VCKHAVASRCDSDASHRRRTLGGGGSLRMEGNMAAVGSFFAADEQAYLNEFVAVESGGSPNESGPV
jgi:hypothetical protein